MFGVPLFCIEALDETIEFRVSSFDLPISIKYASATIHYWPLTRQSIQRPPWSKTSRILNVNRTSSTLLLEEIEQFEAL